MIDQMYGKHKWVNIMSLVVFLLVGFLPLFLEIWNDDDETMDQISHVLIILFVVIFFFIEYQSYKIKPAMYMQDWWNIIDVLLIVLFSTEILLHFLNKQQNKFPLHIDKGEVDYKQIFTNQAILILLTFKLMKYMRIFEKIGFIVDMVWEVAFEAGFFIFMFLIFNSLMALLFMLAGFSKTDANGN